jgi:Protein of unknown function (DUF3800)
VSYSRLHRERFVLPLKAYLDDSGTNGAATVVVVGGFLADEKAWDAFEAKWSVFLAKYGLARFHVSQFWARKTKPYIGWNEDKHLSAFADASHILRTSDIFGVAKAVSLDAFNDWRVELDHPIDPDPYYYCLDKCLRLLIGGVRKSFGPDDGIAIYVDQDKGREPLGMKLAEWHTEKVRRGHSLHVDRNRKTSTHYVSSIDYKPLQAADILANALFRQAVNFLEKKTTEEKTFLEAMKESNMPIQFEFLHDKELFEIEARSRVARSVRERPYREPR